MLGSDLLLNNRFFDGTSSQVSSPSSHMLSTLLWKIPSHAFQLPIHKHDLPIPSSSAVIMRIHSCGSSIVIRRPSFHPCASPLWIVCLVAQSGLSCRTLVVSHSKSPRQSMLFHHSDHLLALSTLRRACFARFSKDDRFCEVIEREMPKGKHGISSIYPRGRVAGRGG